MGIKIKHASFPLGAISGSLCEGMYSLKSASFSLASSSGDLPCCSMFRIALPRSGNTKKSASSPSLESCSTPLSSFKQRNLHQAFVGNGKLFFQPKIYERDDYIKREAGWAQKRDLHQPNPLAACWIHALVVDDLGGVYVLAVGRQYVGHLHTFVNILTKWWLDKLPWLCKFVGARWNGVCGAL